MVEECVIGEGPIRLQAACGLYIEVCTASAGNAIGNARGQASCAGCLEPPRGSVTARHRIVDFQPPTGEAPQAELSLNGVLLTETGLPAGRYCETWMRLESSEG